jgi:NADPH:quinone reductase-like Zn-dependent oxidoreductase
VLELRDVPEPVPGEGEVVVEVRAAALNRRDTLIRAGAGPAYRFPLPLILGSDGAGIRRDTGSEVVILPSLNWGTSESVAGPDFRILGGPRDGTYAELVAVPTENLFPKPPGLSWQQSAALPLAALTAFRALFRVGDLRPGERVVVLGVGSGVSLAAIQLAVHAGAQVAVTSSASSKLARAYELGADAGASYLDADWVGALRERIGEADLVLDSVGTTWAESLRLLRPGGRLVALGGTGGSEVTLDIRSVYLSQKRILGTMMGSPADFGEVLRIVDRGELMPVIDSVSSLGDAAMAHARMESGQHFGKLVLTVSGSGLAT